LLKKASSLFQNTKNAIIFSFKINDLKIDDFDQTPMFRHQASTGILSVAL